MRANHACPRCAKPFPTATDLDHHLTGCPPGVAPPTTLDASRVGALQRHIRYPAVSVLMALGSKPDADRLRLGQLVGQAEHRLRDEFPDRDAEPLLQRLGALVAAADLGPGHRSIGVFVNHDVATTIRLPIAVRERVVIDTTFATRDLVHALHRSPRYQVLVLSERATCLYDGCGSVLTEVAASELRGSESHHRERSARRRPGTDRSALRDRRLRGYIRAVDEAHGRHLRATDRPLILVGATRRLAAFRKHSEARTLVTDTVVGGFDQTSARELAERVWPTIERILADQRREAMAELDRATSRQQAAFGIDEVWARANEGRGARVVVEENYEYAARIDHARGLLDAATDVTHPDVVDDVVDDVIEIVLARHGRATIVPDGDLAEHGRIAMTLRH